MARRSVSVLVGTAAVLSGLTLAPAPAALAEDITAGNPTLAPLKWAGLYKWKKPDGVYQCTAEFITPRVIMLAAHCLRDVNTGQFYDTDNTKSVFFLQYQNDEYTKVYHPLCSGTMRDYVVPLHDGEDPTKPETMSQQRQAEYHAAYLKHWQYDFGFVLLDGESLTGHYNYRINVIANRAASTGYPGAMMGGEVVQYVVGDVINAASLFTFKDMPNVQVLWHGNPAHTQGASGGAWVANFSHDVSPDTNIVVGLNSFDNTGRPGASFGPVFTDNFQKLLTFVENGCQ